MSQVSTSFPDSTYTTSNKPSSATLKTDIAAMETAINDTDTNALKKDGSVALTGNQSTSATPSAATHLATMGAVWPIGSVYLGVVSTNPGTLLGFGTWSAIAGGKMLVGQTSGDADFDTAEETGGAKTATLTTTELPAHTHTGPSHTHTFTTGVQSASHTHAVAIQDTGSGSSGTGAMEPGGSTSSGNQSASHTHSGTTNAGGTGATGSAGTGSAFSIVNPYFVVYAWKRTA